MVNHWAIAIGISQYSHMDPLKYASQDVAALQKYLTDANFNGVYYFSDHSPNVALNGEVTLPTQPTLTNLQRFLELRFATPFLQPEDTLWFFFVGHGWHYGNQDYLMPADGNPDFADSTALSVDLIATYLRKSGTEKIVMVLDACHTETQKFGQGFGTDPKGVVTIFSTDFGQLSRKIDLVKHGSFTYALLDAFQVLGRHRKTSVDHLYHLLRESLPKLNRFGLKPTQTPRLQADSPVTAAMIELPPAKAQKQNWMKRLVLSSKLNLTGEATIPDLNVADGQHSRPSWPIAGLTGAAICISLLSYAGFHQPEWFLSSFSPLAGTEKANPEPSAQLPKVMAQANRVAPTRLVPNRPDQTVALGEVPSERTPRPGVYYTTNPQFTASRREIGKSGDRLCIKLVNGAQNPAKGQPKVVVSSVSRRSNGFYIDATNQKLSLGSFYSELSDGKLLWQRLETDVDESGLMGECLTARAGYIRSYQTN